MEKGHPTKGTRLPVEILTATEVRAMMDACSRRSAIGTRNRALLGLLYRSGLRVSEALALSPKDCDATAGTLRVLHGKGNKARTAAMDPGAFDVLQGWLDRRQAHGLNGRHPLFSSLKGKPLATCYVRALVKRLAEQAGIDKRVHPHAFRHTHAAELAREGVPLNVIQVQLGHSSAATTARYLAHIAPQTLIETVRARTWKAD
jgi:site-specific recombinase XerD